MKKLSGNLFLSGIIALLFFVCFSVQAQSHQISHLQKQGVTTQLIVEDKPFLILGGELGNSSFTSLEYMTPIWPKLQKMNMNTILAPVYWETIEPKEGQFDFILLDQLISESRKHHIKLVLLWFGSWKNSMSSHAPAWVKLNQERFPRVKNDKGMSGEILTPLSDNNLQADVRAFQALMKHIREFDGNDHTVIMVQVENELGMMPSARDYSALANDQFMKNVPKELMQYVSKNKENLVPEFKQIWANNGFKNSGTWEEVFGKSTATDEIFMAWYYSKYVNAVVEAGKSVYPLPMYLNAALNSPGSRPGMYPSGAPLPHLMSIWKAGCPSIDFMSPDFYTPSFKLWCDLYTRQGDPLFVPEHRFDNTVAAKAAYAIGHYEAIGFSPFSVEDTKNPETEPLGKIYHVINQLTPIIAAQQGKHKIEGVLFEKNTDKTIFQLGDYEFTVKHSYALGYEDKAREKAWDPAGAIFVQTGDNEFYIAGSGIVSTFKNLKDTTSIVGILKTEEGRFENGVWKVLRHLNGDQTHQGRHVRIFLEDYSVVRFELYNYK
jgi:beta-galactosidase GanA